MGRYAIIAHSVVLRAVRCGAPGRTALNFVDLSFLLLFVTSLAVGFFQGSIRLVVLIIAFYLSLVLASLYFQPVGGWLVSNFGTTRYVGEYVGFALVLLIGFALLAAAGIYTFRYASLPGQLLYIDKVVGMILGVLLGALLIGMFGVLLWNLMIVRGGQNIDLPVMQWLGRQVAGSFLLQFFANEILPQVYGLLDPILPDSAAIIFAVQ